MQMVQISVFLLTSITLLHPSCAAYLKTRPPVWRDYEDVETLVSFKIDASTCPAPDQLQNHWDWDGESDDCTLFPRIRNPRPLGTRLVRLAFHDAAGKSDGFVDLNNPENDGLYPAVAVLDEMYEERFHERGDLIKDVISKADFYSWAYIAAVKFTAAKQTGNRNVQKKDYIPHIPVKWGRNDYDPENPFPLEKFALQGGHDTAQQVEEYFRDIFGFNRTETVAIMGVHTLGGARRMESGFSGMWTQSKNKLNSDYYSNMMNPTPMQCTKTGGMLSPGQDKCKILEGEECLTDKGNRCLGWEQRPVRFQGTWKYQWKHSCDANGKNCHHLMLNADIALFKDIDDYLCKKEDGPSCPLGKIKGFPPKSDCAKRGETRILASCFANRSATADIVADNAENMENWIDLFATIFDRMITNTDDVLTEIKPEVRAKNGEDCPDVNSNLCNPIKSSNTFPCEGCLSKTCERKRGRKGKRMRRREVFKCRPKRRRPKDW